MQFNVYCFISETLSQLFFGDLYFETGISDFHKIIRTLLKIHYKKQKAKIIQYWDYKNFADEAFKTEHLILIKIRPNLITLVTFLYQCLTNMLLQNRNYILSK